SATSPIAVTSFSRGASARAAPLLVARQPVVWNRLPGSRVRDVLAVLRAYAGIVVERAETHAEHVGVARAVAPERTAANRAERLGPAVAWRPLAHELLALDDPQRSRSDARLRGCRGAGSPLAARAVAIRGRDERLGHLVAHGATEAAAGERGSTHGTSLSSVRQIDTADVEPERLRQPHAVLEVFLEHADVGLAHQRTDELARLRTPERVLREQRQEPVRGRHELLVHLPTCTLQQDALVGHARAVVDAVVDREAVAEILEHRAA